MALLLAVTTLNLTPPSRKRKSRDDIDSCVAREVARDYMKIRFNYVREKLSRMCLKGKTGLLWHAISSQDKEPCIQTSMYIMKNIIGFSDRTLYRAIQDLRIECKSPYQWLQLLYLSLYYSSRAVRIGHPEGSHRVTKEQELSLLNTARALKEKQIQADIMASSHV